MAKRTRIISDGWDVHVDTPDGKHREFRRGTCGRILEVQGNGAWFPVTAWDGRTSKGTILDGESLLDAVRRLHKARAI